MLNPAALRNPSQVLPAIVIWAGVGLLCAGFMTHALWRELPAGRFGQGLLLAAMATWPLRHWLRWGRAEALACVWRPAPPLMTSVPERALIARMRQVRPAQGPRRHAAIGRAEWWVSPGAGA